MVRILDPVSTFAGANLFFDLSGLALISSFFSVYSAEQEVNQSTIFFQWLVTPWYLAWTAPAWLALFLLFLVAVIMADQLFAAVLSTNS